MEKRGADPCNGKAHFDGGKAEGKKGHNQRREDQPIFTEEYSSEEIENIIYQLLEEWNAANGVSKQ